LIKSRFSLRQSGTDGFCEIDFPMSVRSKTGEVLFIPSCFDYSCFASKFQALNAYNEFCFDIVNERRVAWLVRLIARFLFFLL
jgi:hypothetical protein